MKKTTLLAFSIFCLMFFAASVFAQHGGKAEPNRIKFAAGASSKVISGSLSNGTEAEYVFSAQKGQKITVKNTRPSAFDFRVFNDEFNIETEYESSPTLTIEVPETGDYFFYVRKKAGGLRTARYSLTLTIK